MTHLITQRQIIGIVIPLSLLLALNSLFGVWQAGLIAKVQQATTISADWQTKQAQLTDDINTAQDLRQRLKRETTPALYLPVDERAALQLAELLAARHGLRQAQFTISSDVPVAAQTLSLVQKRLNLTATTPHDGYVLKLLADLTEKLPGKLQPVRLALTRNNASSDLTAGLAVEAEWLWLIQGTQLADAEPQP